MNDIPKDKYLLAMKNITALQNVQARMKDLYALINVDEKDYDKIDMKAVEAATQRCLAAIDTVVDKNWYAIRDTMTEEQKEVFDSVKVDESID